MDIMNWNEGEITQRKELARARRELRLMLDSEYGFEGRGDMKDILELLEEDSSYASISDELYDLAEQRLTRLHPEKREDVLKHITSDGSRFYGRSELIEKVLSVGDIYQILTPRKAA